MLLDSFLEQVNKDGERINKKPMLCWKKDYKDWLVFIKTENTPKELLNEEKHIKYKGWSIFPLSKILTCSDDFFFQGNKND